ncbi:ATP-grasp domain-containing protein [Streptomyces beigongshangae]|uniref:ATP-grasp domain-containing protein n=1 Tax=Streptomyces beigongshangae TaxID=2841597 RepID=UPI001C85AD82|nr:ATP-grasp domain-containing protein [Streptomyces sp. REN17]
MANQENLPRLVFLDGPGPPPAKWYLPKLTENFEVHVLWSPTGDDAKDALRAQELGRFCDNSPLLGGDNSLRAVLEFSRKWHPEGILGFSELVVTETHAAALELGLPANLPESLRALRSKEEQRIALARAGVPVPGFASVLSLSDLVEAVAEVGLPAVLKPSAGVGSMATYHVTEDVDLTRLWDMATSRYTADPRGNGLVHFVLEEMLIGERWHDDPRYAPYVSVESLVQNGSVTHCAVTDKFPLSEPFRENGNVFPSNLPGHRIESILECATQAICAMGIMNSMVHTEVMLTAAGPRIIEVNSRLGGGVIEMLRLSFDYDIVTAMANVATGRPTAPMGPRLRSSAQYVPQSPARDVTLAQVPTVGELLAFDGVVEAELFYQAGDRPDWVRGTSGGKLARLIATSESPEQLLDLADFLASDKAFTYVPD